jgi:hypothetical protein
VGPDGQHAVVGHNAWISYVDLVGAVVEKSIPVAADVGDCGFAGNGWAYLFPRVDQWVEVHGVEISTGIDSPSGTGWLYAGSKACLAGDGQAIYTVTVGLAPADIHRWDVSKGAAVWAWDSPYHGDHPMGPGLWMSADGTRVLTAAGTAFRSSPARPQDLLYGGALSGLSGVAHLDAAPGEIAAIPSTNPWLSPSPSVDGTVELFDDEFLGNTGRLTLPRWQVGSWSYAVHGRYVFYGAGYSRKHVVVQADGASGLSNDLGVLTY